VDEQKIGVQVSQLATGEVEILDVTAHRLGQGGDQLAHALGIGVAHERDHGAAAAAQPSLEVTHIGVEVGEPGLRNLAQESAIPRLGDPRGAREDEHPFGDRLRVTGAPGLARPGPVVAGGEVGDRGDDVVVAANADDEGDPVSAWLHRGRDDDGRHGVGDGGDREARQHARAVARGQRLAGRGNGVGVVAAHPLRAQAGKLGREHQEAVTGESARERDQPRIVAAFRGDAGDHEQRRSRIG
jgi:hypothetical protein